MSDISSPFVVFVDESGDHSLDSINAEWPLFVLCFCIFRKSEYIHQITPAIRELKFNTFGHDLVILHEHDIRKRKNAFAKLGQAEREGFLESLTQIISSSNMTVVAVVIDKLRHRARYSKPMHPYYLAMQFGLERVRKFLELHNASSKPTPIIFEARGKAEDSALELEFRRVGDHAIANGEKFPFDILIADKKTNCEGLQLADLTARPIGLSVLKPNQENRASTVIKSKLFAGKYNCVVGNGLKVFP